MSQSIPVSMPGKLVTISNRLWVPLPEAVNRHIRIALVSTRPGRCPSTFPICCMLLSTRIHVKRTLKGCQRNPSYNASPKVKWLAVAKAR